MNLYTHQQKIIDDDPKKTGLFLGTGSGKTRIALLLARGKTLVIAPKTQKEDGNWEREHYLLKSSCFIGEPMVISKETFRRDHAKLPAYDTVIVDECFVAKTPVLTTEGYQNIENIKVGTGVATAIGWGEVTNVTRKITTTLCVVTLTNGKKIFTTKEHPFLTINRGWVVAGELKDSDILMSKDMLELEYEKDRNMCYLREADSAWMASRRIVGTIQKNMQSNVSGYTQSTGYRFADARVDEGGETTRQSSIEKNDRKKSDAFFGDKTESVSNIKKNRTSAFVFGWEWTRTTFAAKNIISGLKKGLGCRICHPNKKTSRKGVPNLLQSRCCLPSEKNSNRGRRKFSWGINSKKTRQKERLITEINGVESVTIQKSRGTFVYNLSVKGHPSYIVENIIVHNCHTLLGATPNTKWKNKQQIPKTSQLFEALETYIKRTTPARFYLCTATILRSPMTLWAAAKVLGHNWNFYEFRQAFYVKLPMPGRDVWSAKTDSATKDRLARAVRSLGYTGRLEDYFDVPAQTYKTTMFDLTKEQKECIKTLALSYPDPLVRLTKQHQVENGVLLGDEYTLDKTFPNEKLDAILEYAVEFPKMIVFVKYRKQLEMIEQALTKKGYTTLTLTGDTKNRGEVIAKVNALSSCVFLVQSQVSAGWEVPDCPVMLFASMTYSLVDRVQAEGRILRANALKKNLYITLSTKGGVDEAVAKSIENKKDFDARIYLGV